MIEFNGLTEKLITCPYVNLPIPHSIILNETLPNQSSAKAEAWHVKKHKIKVNTQVINVKLKVKSSIFMKFHFGLTSFAPEIWIVTPLKKGIKHTNSMHYKYFIVNQPLFLTLRNACVISIHLHRRIRYREQF